MTAYSNAISVFISYAHQDEPLLRKLETHLSLLKRQGLISTWSDRRIAPGTDWSHIVDEHLERSSIILLLISADFLSSDYCYDTEMRRALQLHEAGQVRVVPIIVRACSWKDSPFARLQCLSRDGKPVTTWENRDVAWTDVVAGIRRVIQDLSLLSASASRAALPAIWNIPYPRNPFFIGRDDLLSQLHTQLQAGQTTALSQSPQAVSGLGGIGKTQIAVEYAFRYSWEYETVLWIRAESKDTLISSYNTIAMLLKLPESEAEVQDIIIRTVNVWLQTHDKWLLIFDNADDLDLLTPFLPPFSRGHILLTTRSWDMQRLAIRLEVESFSDEQGAAFLLRRSGLLALDTELSQAMPTERVQMMQLTQELGGLPLALDQAGAYLEATGMSVEEYLLVYQKHRRKLLSERRSRIGDHPDSVITTWSLSFERVEKKNLAAADLLRLCAYLAPDAIPEEILTQGAHHMGPLLEPVVSDSFLLAQAIEALRAYSLINRDPRTRTLSVHRLVQAVIRESTSKKASQQWKQRVALAVNAACPNVKDVKQWNACERWLPHAQICAIWMEQEQRNSSKVAHHLNEAGYYLNKRARYDQAEPFLRRALSIREHLLGPDHLDTAQGLNNLAYLYYEQGKYEQAEPLLQRALAIREQVLDPLHPDLAIGLNNLAMLYHMQGKYKQAEPLLQRSLTIREKVLGPLHPKTATSLNSLAFLYQEQGKYEQAELLFQSALTIREQVLDPLHPYIAMSAYNLAVLYSAQGKYTQAELLFQRALMIHESQLGLTHPSTVLTLKNYSSLLRKLKREDEAIALERKITL